MPEPARITVRPQGSEWETRPVVRSQPGGSTFWGSTGQPISAEDLLKQIDFGAPFRSGAVALGEELARPVTDTVKMLRGRMSEQEQEQWQADRLFDIIGGGLGSKVAPAMKLGAKVIPAIMAGPMAKTADRKALAVAQFLERAGDDRHTIYKKTGWMRDEDSNWKFWISDKEFKVKPGIKQDIRDGQTVFTAGEIFHNPPVFEAYPGLKNLRVEVDTPMRGTATGETAAGHWPGAPSEGGLPEHRAYGTFGKKMGFRSERLFGKDKMAASDPVHEMGHAVELYEGWPASGGNVPEVLNNKLTDMVNKGQLTHEEAQQMAASLQPKTQKEMYDLYRTTLSERNQYNANRRFVHPQLENLPPFYTRERKGRSLVFSVEDLDPQQAEKTPIFEGINGKYYHLVPVERPGLPPKMEVQSTGLIPDQAAIEKGVAPTLQDLTSAKPITRWPWPMYDPRTGK